MMQKTFAFGTVANVRSSKTGCSTIAVYRQGYDNSGQVIGHWSPVQGMPFFGVVDEIYPIEGGGE